MEWNKWPLQLAWAKVGRWLALIFGFLAGPAGWAQPGLVVSNPAEAQLIGRYCQVWEDSSAQASLAQVLSPDGQANFVASDKNLLSGPVTTSAFWFKITLQNRTGQDLYLQPGGPSSCWLLDFYRPDGAGGFAPPVRTGALRPGSREYPVNFYWLRLATAQDTAAQTYYLRLHSRFPPNFLLQAGTLAALHREKDKTDFFTAGFVGLMLAMFCYNLFLALVLRSQIYFIYIGYLFTVTLSLTYNSDYPLLTESPFWWEYFYVWHHTNYLFQALFAIVYLRLKDTTPRFYWWVLGLTLLLCGVVPVLNLLGQPWLLLSNISQLAVLLFYLSLLGVGIFLWAKGKKEAFFYVLGWSFVLISVFVFIFTVNGLLPFNLFTRNSMYIGVALEALMFSFALAAQINKLRRQREEAQAQIVAQVKKNADLIKGQNLALERKVVERTAELQGQRDQMEVQAAQLAQANQTKDKLFAIIGHDMRSPIGALGSLLDLLSAGHISPEDFVNLAPDLRRNVRNVQYTLDNLLQWSNSQLQGMSISPGPVDLGSTIAEIGGLMSETARAKLLELVQATPTGQLAWADANHVRLILRNLIGNAIKFTPQGGRITVSATDEGAWAAFSVADTGMGMSPEQMAKLFRPDTHFSTYGTGQEKGTGLGLLLCKEMAETNGGSIAVQSQVGQGSTFTVRLPKAPAAG
jgi:signal transduction histidine kinase